MPKSPTHRLCAVLLSATAPMAVLAQPVTMPTQVADVFSIDVGGSIEHHDNIFRVKGGPSDTVLRGLIGARFERDISLQRISIYGTLEPVKYLDYSSYDYLGYTAGAVWDIEVGRPLFGQLSARAARTQSAFDSIGGAQDNLQDTVLLRGLVGFRITQSWAAIGALDWYDVENSLATQQGSNYERTGYEAGFRYAPGTGTRLDFVYRNDQGEYPNRQVFDSLGNLLPGAVDNGYSQDTLLLRAAYRPSDASSIGGSIGYTRRDYDNVPERDFSGLTGSVDVEWPLSGAVQMRASAYRRLESEELLTSSYADVLGMLLTPRWAMSARVALEGILLYEDRRYEGDPGFVFTGAEIRKDKVLDFGVRVNYELARRVFVYADLRRRDRSSNYEQYDYTDNWFGLGIRAAF